VTATRAARAGARAAAAETEQEERKKWRKNVPGSSRDRGSRPSSSGKYATAPVPTPWTVSASRPAIAGGSHWSGLEKRQVEAGGAGPAPARPWPGRRRRRGAAQRRRRQRRLRAVEFLADGAGSAGAAPVHRHGGEENRIRMPDRRRRREEEEGYSKRVRVNTRFESGLSMRRVFVSI